MHASVVRALRGYETLRDRTVARTADSPFFISLSRQALPSSTVHYVFSGLRERLGWVARGGHARPRIHDLRHTFAVHRVQLWHKSGMPVDQGMLWLCTYLGHAKISDTYWYLTATPALLAVVGSTFERFACSAEVTHA